MRLALIPSPFVGASAWRPVARRLPDAVGVDYGLVAAPRWYEEVAARIADAAGERPWVAVMHSGAGAFAPALAAAAPSSLAGLIFVDSVLPHPGRSALAMSPAEHAERLRSMTTDGLLAPWSDWFGPAAMERLIPDPAARAEFLADMPRVPLAFLEAEAPDDARWETLPAAYVQLSRAYADQARRAGGRGWSVRRLEANHLAMVTQPDAVAEALAGLP